MRLTRRLDSLARRLPHEPTSGEDAINRAVFARYQQETDAARAAAAPIDYDAYTREFEAAYAAHGETLLVLRHSGCDGIETCQRRACLRDPESPIHRRFRHVARRFPTRHFFS